MTVKSNKSGIIIAIDLGTSNLKTAAYDLDGKELCFESTEYRLHTPSNGIVENDPEKYWDNLVRILKKIVINLGDRKKYIIAIGTTSQGETIVPVNRYGKPLRDAIVWLDKRSVNEAQEISKNFDETELFLKTGQPEVDASWPAARILWIKRNEPEIFNHTYKFLLLEDFIIYKLTGKFYGESSVYNSSYYYDIIKFKYIDEMLNFLGIAEEKLPEIVKPGSFIGEATNDVTKDIGFPKRVKVVIGAMDQICGALGAGNVEEGVITETTGSAFAMIATTRKPIFNKKYKIPCAIHAIPNLYCLLPYSMTGGMVLKWFKDSILEYKDKPEKKADQITYEMLDKLAEKTPAGADGLIMLPYLTGAYFPEFNPRARGVFFNFGVSHTKGHFIRAIMESLGYTMKGYLKLLGNIGINVEKVISMGGGAKSFLWNQIKSDICETPIQVPEYTETALLGCALLTGHAIGAYKDLKITCKEVVKIKAEFQPNVSNSTVYIHNYKKYADLYDRVKDLF